MMYNIPPIISKQNLEYVVVLLTGGIGYNQYVVKNLMSTFMYIFATDHMLMCGVSFVVSSWKMTFWFGGLLVFSALVKMAFYCGHGL